MAHPTPHVLGDTPDHIPSYGRIGYVIALLALSLVPQARYTNLISQLALLMQAPVTFAISIPNLISANVTHSHCRPEKI